MLGSYFGRSTRSLQEVSKEKRKASAKREKKKTVKCWRSAKVEGVLDRLMFPVKQCNDGTGKLIYLSIESNSQHLFSYSIMQNALAVLEENHLSQWK